MTKITSLFNVKFTFLHIAVFIIIICYHNIYIFTEESVLLFCFIAWLNITWNYISPQINEFLEGRRNKINSTFQYVTNNNITTWKKYRQGYSLKAAHVKVLNSIIPYLMQLIKTLIFLESKSSTLQSITPYLKRLQIVKDLESKLTKISYATTCQRIKDMAVIRNFYSNQLKIKSFHSESKLDFLERVRKLKIGY
uniref:Ymf39 n=1 Tax=Pyropia dentata TaxID=76160 RepID=A0A8J9WW63_PYRDN|nr:ATP synthase F0 subunit b [Neoporphyra dentata]WKD83567.1 ATP synthase F0 subunit b [Neoporphyra dentata]BDB33256.1 Ymf39 [Neoporphyra dentata]